MNNKSQILDELLVLQAQQGDKEAFEQLVKKWNKKLIYQSYIRTKDWEQSQDIIQEVWHWLLSNINKLKEVSIFGSWIRTVVERRSIDWIRKQQRIRDKNKQVLIDYGNTQVIDASSNDYPDPMDDVHEQSLTLLEKAICEMTSENKLILMLYYTESNSIASISKILGIPNGTVKSRLFHAREKLKKKLNAVI